MVASVPTVANKFHPSNHLAHSKESQDLGANYTDCYHLLSTHIPRSVEDSLWGHGACAVCGLIESSGRVPNSIDEWL